MLKLYLEVFSKNSKPNSQQVLELFLKGIKYPEKECLQWLLKVIMSPRNITEYIISSNDILLRQNTGILTMFIRICEDI